MAKSIPSTPGSARRRAERESGYMGPLDQDGNRVPPDHPHAVALRELGKLPQRAK